jgi:hypothetical protein
VRGAVVVAATCLLACAGGKPPHSTAPCDPGGAAPISTGIPAACEDLATPVASDLAECTSSPDVIRYIGDLRDSLVEAMDCSTGPSRAELRLHIRRDGTLADPCVVGTPQPLAASVLAAVRKIGRAPAPTGDVVCLVGAPLTLYITVRPN